LAITAFPVAGRNSRDGKFEKVVGRKIFLKNIFAAANRQTRFADFRPHYFYL
jgi:hypothetical protein